MISLSVSLKANIYAEAVLTVDLLLLLLLLLFVCFKRKSFQVGKPFYAAVENYWSRAPITSYYNSINIFRMIMDNETLWICFIPFRNCRCIVHMYRIQKASCNGISDAYEKILTIEDVSWSLERLLYLRFDIQKCIFYKIQPWIWHETILRNIKLKRIRSQNILLC